MTILNDLFNQFACWPFSSHFSIFITISHDTFLHNAPWRLSSQCSIKLGAGRIVLGIGIPVKCKRLKECLSYSLANKTSNTSRSLLSQKEIQLSCNQICCPFGTFYALYFFPPINTRWCLLRTVLAKHPDLQVLWPLERPCKSRGEVGGEDRG